MGDIKTVIERTLDNLVEAGYVRPLGKTNRHRAEVILWAMWDASYSQGYADGVEDAFVEE